MAALLAGPVAAAAALLAAALALALLLLARRARRGGGGRGAPAAAAAAARPAPRGYTRAEVARHCRDDDCWLIVRNRGSDRLKVYDVTAYLEAHPGGDAILRNAGADSTEGFLGPQHPPTTSDLLEAYCIGWLADDGEGQAAGAGGAASKED